MKKCEMCGAALFRAEYRESCGACPHNGVWDPVACVYRYPDNEPADRNRDQCGMEWECALGANFNAGCRLVTCAVCGHEAHVPHLNREGVR